MEVRGNCPDCGLVYLPFEDLHVRLCADTKVCSYWFRCPECETRVASWVTSRDREMILSHPAIVPDCWYLPLELFEAKEGPKISEADIEAFHVALERQ